MCGRCREGGECINVVKEKGTGIDIFGRWCICDRYESDGV